MLHRLRHLKSSTQAACLLLALSHPFARAAEVKARPADSFVDSIGVAGHFTKTDGPYSSNYQVTNRPQDSLRSLIQQLGIRHVRCGAPGHASSQWINQRIIDLYHGLGIKSVVVVDRRLGAYNVNSDLDTSQTEIDKIVDNLGLRNHAIYFPADTTPYYLWPAIEAIEGPNEYEVSNNAVNNLNLPVTDLNNWAPKLQTFMANLRTSVLGETNLSGIPIIAPALLVPEFLDEQDAANSVNASIDAGNGHCYAVRPDRPEKMERFHHLVVEGSRVWPNKELWMTETGYHTAVNEAAAQGISERAQRKYQGRMLAQAFQRGVKRTFLYEFCDQWVDATENVANGGINKDGIAKNNGQAAFGLVALTNTTTPTDLSTANFGSFTLRPKPAFHALRNLITILKDPGAPFYAGSLNYTLNSSFNIGDILLQKRDGKFYLVLWNSAVAYGHSVDTNGKRVPPGFDFTNAAQAVTVTFPDGVSSVKQWTPGTNADSTGVFAGATTLTVTASGTSTVVNVPDELTILEITPSTPKLAANKNLIFEAESGSAQPLFSPFQVVKYDGAMGQEFVQVPATAGFQGAPTSTSTGQCQYTFSTASPGTVTAWYRVNFPDAASNSLYTQLDSTPVTQIDTITTGWAWRSQSWLNVAAGTHTLKIARREAGAAIDRSVLSFVASGTNPFNPTLNASGNLLFAAESVADQDQFRPFIIENLGSGANSRRILVPNSPTAIGPPSGPHPFSIGSDGNVGASNINQGTAHFQFDVSDSAALPMNVYVHLDRAAPGGADDSFNVQLNNNGAWVTVNGITGNGWHKITTPFVVTGSGPQTIKVQWRESGTYLYRVWLTTSNTATPPN
jgi:hypothetical protein